MIVRPTTGQLLRDKLNAKLVQMPQRTIVGSQSFEAKVGANADRIEDIVGAFDDALGKALKRIVQWTLVQGHRGWLRRRRVSLSSLPD